MTYICKKEMRCIDCGHYRLDEEEGKWCCFAQQDEKAFHFFYHLKETNATIEIRPWEKREWHYYYKLPYLQAVVAGQIGRLRMDFGHGGNEFWTTWENCEANVAAKTQVFKDIFDEVINLLRKDSSMNDCGPFSNLRAMRTTCYALDALHLKDEENGTCGFRIDVKSPAGTEDYTLFVLLIPRMGDYNAYVYCFRAAILQQWEQKVSKGIRFICQDGDFFIQNGGKIVLTHNDGKKHEIHTCLFLDAQHFIMGLSGEHDIYAFAEYCKENGITVRPATKEDEI